jgi:hypothetical protein
MVVACIALAVALAGTSYAAVTLPKNSVGTKQLKRNAVTSIKVKNNALTGADVLEARLAKVPSAARADTATTAGCAAPSGGAGGGLSGTYPAPSIAGNAVGSANVVDASQATGLRKSDIAAVATTVMFDPPNIAANSCSVAGTPVPGAQVGDMIITHPVSSYWGTLTWAPLTVIPGGTVVIRVCNTVGFSQDGGPLPFSLLLIR